MKIWPSVLRNISNNFSAKKTGSKGIQTSSALSCVYIYRYIYLYLYIYSIYLANTCVFALFSENVNDHVDEIELLFLWKDMGLHFELTSNSPDVNDGGGELVSAAVGSPTVLPQVSNSSTCK